MSTREAYIDPTSTAMLAPGWMAAELVSPDGTREPWVINLNAGPTDTAGCSCRNCAPHEQVAVTA